MDRQPIRKRTEPAFIESVQCKPITALPADQKWTFNEAAVRTVLAAVVVNERRNSLNEGCGLDQRGRYPKSVSMRHSPASTQPSGKRATKRGVAAAKRACCRIRFDDRKDVLAVDELARRLPSFGDLSWDQLAAFFCFSYQRSFAALVPVIFLDFLAAPIADKETQLDTLAVSPTFRHSGVGVVEVHVVVFVWRSLARSAIGAFRALLAEVATMYFGPLQSHQFFELLPLSLLVSFFHLALHGFNPIKSSLLLLLEATSVGAGLLAEA